MGIEQTEFRHNPTERTIETAGRVYTDYHTDQVDIHKLRRFDFGRGFRPATLGEILDLTYQAYLHQGNPAADKVVQAARQEYGLCGDTMIFYADELVIFQDHPNTKMGDTPLGFRMIRDEKALTAKLSKSTKEGVRFSDDGTIRGIDYGFETGWKQDADHTRREQFLVALFGKEEAPEMLAEIQNRTNSTATLWAQNIKYSHGDGEKFAHFREDVNDQNLVINAWHKWGSLHHGYSFGVRK